MSNFAHFAEPLEVIHETLGFRGTPVEKHCCTAIGLNNDAEKCNLFGSYLRGKASVLRINAKYNGVTVDNWRSMKDHFMLRYKGQVKTNTFCHQITKRFQEKTETVSDFAERCITGMQEFIDSIAHPANTNYDAEYLAQTRAHQNEH